MVVLPLIIPHPGADFDIADGLFWGKKSCEMPSKFAWGGTGLVVELGLELTEL